MSNSYTSSFTARAEDIDELGHVNNIVWLRWVQDIATAHWSAVAPAEQVARYVWVVTRHEIDYRGNIIAGEQVAATTFIPDPPRGARFDRCVGFRNEEGRIIVSARSTWAMLERANGRPARIGADIVEAFRSVRGAPLQ